MRQTFIGTVGLLAAALTWPPPLLAQRIDNEIPSRERVVRVQTALNHLTVIEVAEPVTTVAVGSPQAFKIERRENKVLIQPLQENVATNLFIWTTTTRLNYELVPAIGDAGQMDFAIDYREPQAQPQAQITQPKSAPQAGTVTTVPSEMLLGGTPVRLVGNERAKTKRALVIRDVYRKEDEVFVRYSIENRSDHTFRAGVPTVVSLSQPKLDWSLWTVQYSQLGTEYETRLKTNGAAIPVRITRCEPGVADVAPGQARLGVMTLELPIANTTAKSGQPTVLRFQVPVDQGSSLSATLVL